MNDDLRAWQLEILEPARQSLVSRCASLRASATSLASTQAETTRARANAEMATRFSEIRRDLDERAAECPVELALVEAEIERIREKRAP